jgi:outer membrane protein insertion porin family
MHSMNFSKPTLKLKTDRIGLHFQVSGRCLAISLLLFFISGCTGLKYVPDNEILYTGADIKLIPQGRVKAKKRLKALLDQNVSPKPNSSIFGMRPGLWFYYKAGPLEKKKGLRAFIKNKLGQVPVYMSDVDVKKVTNLIKGDLINHGFFQAEVKAEVKTKKKTGKILYIAHVQKPYRLRNIDYPKTDTFFVDVDSIKKESYLKTNQRYNLERMQAEQTRIEQSLEDFGYYYFDDRYLLFEADSTVGKRQIDLKLTIEKGVPEKALRIYRIGDITIFPDYTLSQDSLVLKADTLHINGYNYVDKQKNYKPYIITQVVNLKKGNIYRRQDREYTLSHLMSLGSFKFVDIKFTESPKDSFRLNTSIFLTPYQKKSVRAEVQATSKSNNFVGPGFSLRYTDRNLFRGSEKLELNVNTGYEVQISRKVGRPLNAFELGLDAGISVPRFISPFNIYYPSRKYLPTTDIKMGFRLQQRIGYFRLNSLNLAYGYTWKENTLKTHELYPIDVSYMKLGHTSELFDRLIHDNPFLAKSLENQFIMGARYSYTLNTQVNQDRMNKFREQRVERTHFYFNGKLESAGNLMQLLHGGGFKNNIENESHTLAGQAYSQFLRAEVDFRYFWQLSETTVLANRIAAGTGYAYGNSLTMPYIRQFAVGGSNSIRAFPARSIGPGTFDVRHDTTVKANENRILFLDQRGDIRLEGSTEFRFDITKVVKGAVFMDAGNIWLWREDPQRPGSQFKRDQFLKELAVGTGAGLRFDFNFFVLRFDLAFPVRKPYLPANERWVWNKIDFSSSEWRGDNLILNIAIGYPF